MKKTKKLLACLIAAATMFTMGSTAFAEEVETPTTYTDQSKVTIKKQYNLEGQGTSPAENFKFTVAKTGVSDSAITNPEDMPEISVGDIHFDENSASTVSASTDITLPQYNSVGVYTYTITEKPGKTAGVTYDSSPVVLKVTVVDDNGDLKRIVSLKKDGTKLSDDVNAFTNIYRAGTLDISKNVAGNLGDKNKYFAFDVTLNGQIDKDTAKSFSVGKTSYEKNPETITTGVKTTFYLKHGETLDIKNLPYGLTYTVEEHDYTTKEGYTTTVNKKDGRTLENQTVKNGTEKAEFINYKNNNKIDTGVNLTTLPYILVFAGVIVIAGAAFITRRRKYED